MKNIKKILDNKLLMMPLILVLTASIAMFAFSPSSVKSDPNKGYPFKAVEYCMPKFAQVVMQKIIKGIFSSFPYVGVLFKAIPDKYYPVPCGCSDSTIDSNIFFMDIKDNPFDFLGSGFKIPLIDYAPTQSTQKELESTLTKEVVPRWEELKKQQDAMIKSQSSKTYDPEVMNEFQKAFKQLHDILVNANSLAYASNFENEFNKKFPNMSARVEKLSESEKRMAGAWKTVMDAWMKGLNVSGRNFTEEQKIRNMIANSILKSFNDAAYEYGQTQVLQALGTIAAQINGTVDRSKNEWAGIAEMCMHCMQMEREYEAISVKNVEEIAKEAAKFATPSSSKYDVGL